MSFSRSAARAALISGLMACGATGALPASDEASPISASSRQVSDDTAEGTAGDSPESSPGAGEKSPEKAAGDPARQARNPVTIDLPGGGRMVVDLADPRTAELLIRSLRQLHVEPLPEVPASRYCIGIMVHPLTPEARAVLPIEGDTGVVVQETLPGSPAALAGLEKNDVITRVGEKSISDPAALVSAVDEAGKTPVTIHFLRKGEPRSVELTATLREELLPEEAASRKMLDGLAQENQELHDAITRLRKDPANRLHPGMMITRMGPGFVTGPGMGPGAVGATARQLEDLTGTIKDLKAEVARLRETVDKLQKQVEETGRK